MATPAPRFEDLTETTGIPLSREGASMMYTRYSVAADIARGKDVLEIACGSGQGLGMLARDARFVVGGDFSMPLLRNGRAHYGDRMPLLRLSANALPFADASFDVVLCFEALYYVPNPERAFDEMTRVLRPGGTVMIVSANPSRPDFIHSPHTVHYHTAAELKNAFESRGLTVKTQGAFPVEAEDKSAKSAVVHFAFGIARRVLEALHLVPRTLRGRARLKRLVMGRLVPVPAELPPDFAPIEPRVDIRPETAAGVKVLYVTAAKAAPKR